VPADATGASLHGTLGGTPSCAILVLNWNGRKHLDVLLPSLQAAVAYHGSPVAIVVVDNRSTQDDAAYVREHYPGVEVVVAERNDFMFSLNPAVTARSEDVVVILNNDMRVAVDFLAPLLDHFSDPSVFAVSAHVFEWDGSAPQIGQRLIQYRNYWLYYSRQLELPGPRHTAEAGGGCSAFRRSYFIELGGFDPLFRPAYFEDFDLTYRAWRRGWKSLVEPRSVIFHRGGATLMDAPRAAGRMQRVLRRNHALFMLKEVGDWRFVTGFLALLPSRIWRAVRAGDRPLALGLLTALMLAPKALWARFRRGKTSRMTPGALADLIESPWLPAGTERASRAG
jgi:GT2 family glycosyltransferase